MTRARTFPSPNIPAGGKRPSRLAAGQRRDSRLAPQALNFRTVATPKRAFSQPGAASTTSASPPAMWGGAGGGGQPPDHEALT